MGDSEAGDREYVVEYLDNACEKVNWIKRAGRARVVYPNGDEYVGHYNTTGKRHGHGEYTYTHEELGRGKYVGQWFQGLKHGQGEMHYPSGDVYRGAWQRSARHGEGTYTYANGDKYSGSWQHDKKSGRGTYVSKSGGYQLVGEWRDNNMLTGKMVYGSSCVYEGTFAKNAPAGKGLFVFHHGAQAEGEFERKQGEEEAEEEEGEGKPARWRTRAVGPSLAPLSELTRAPPAAPAFAPAADTFRNVRVEELAINATTGTQYVELFNAGTEAVDLRGLQLRKKDDARAVFTFVDALQLQSGHRVRVLTHLSASLNPPAEDETVQNVLWTAEDVWAGAEEDVVCLMCIEDERGQVQVLQSFGPEDRVAAERRRLAEAARARAAAEAAAEAETAEGAEEGEDEDY